MIDLRMLLLVGGVGLLYWLIIHRPRRIIISGSPCCAWSKFSDIGDLTAPSRRDTFVMVQPGKYWCVAFRRDHGVQYARIRLADRQLVWIHYTK